MANLLIVESPAKAKTIRKYLGNNYRVVASMGHVRDLPKSKLGIEVENNFEPNYIAIRGKGELIRELKKEAKAAKKIYLGTDPDREGEAISWHLSNILGLDPTEPIRVTFNEITKSAVQKAIKNPRPLDMNLVDAQQARRILDRLVGYKISPFLWNKVRKGLSAGRVQSVATRLIVDREEEIEAFVSEEYWTIDAMLAKSSGASFKARFHGTAGGKLELPDGKAANKVTDAVKTAAYTVGNVKKSQKKRSPAPPFTTSTMQQEAARRLGFTSKKTMSIAQELYEGIDVEGVGLTALITYMRTDSLRISQEALDEVRTFIGLTYGEEYRPSEPRKFKSRSSAQDAHETIRPITMMLPPDKLKGSIPRDAYRLYKLIWDRFVACQMEAQVLNVVSVDVEAADYIFKASGHTVQFAGFTAVYEEPSDDLANSSGKLPELLQGEVLTLEELTPEQHFTQPPPRFTEASVIKALEENGIGRPSTYAPTISTILSREYVIKEGKSFKPTLLGIVTTKLMKEHFKDIVDVEFTANMEDNLDKVEAGKVEWKRTVGDFYTGFDKELKEAEKNLGDQMYRVPDEESDEVCELCGRKMVIKKGRFGKFLACPGYPECKNTKPLIEDTGAKCPKCGGRIVKRLSKNRNKYYVCEHAPACSFISWYEPSKENCPLCGSVMLQKVRYGKKSMICSNEDCPNGEKPEPKESSSENTAGTSDAQSGDSKAQA